MAHVTSSTLALRSASALIFHTFLLANLRVRTTQAIKSSCNSTVECGGTATVTCYFDRDLTGLQHDLQVVLQNDDGTENVLVFAWFNGIPEFYTSPMYKFDGKISDHLHIQIPVVQTSNSGHYTCLVGQSEPEDSTSCLLNVTECQQVTFDESNVQNLSKSFSLEKAEDVAQNYPYVVPIVLGATLLLVTLVIIVVVCTRKKMFYRCLKKTESDPENVEDDKASRTPLKDDKASRTPLKDGT